MADSEVFYPSDYSGRHQNHVTLNANAATKYPKGTMVARDANGRAARPAAGLPVSGVSEGDFDNTAGANDAMLVELAIGEGRFNYTGTVPKACQILYAVDNVTVSIDSSSGTRGVAGIAVEAGAGGLVRLMIDPLLNKLLTLAYLLDNPGADGTVIKVVAGVPAWAADAT